MENLTKEQKQELMFKWMTEDHDLCNVTFKRLYKVGDESIVYFDDDILKKELSRRKKINALKKPWLKKACYIAKFNVNSTSLHRSIISNLILSIMMLITL